MSEKPTRETTVSWEWKEACEYWRDRAEKAEARLASLGSSAPSTVAPLLEENARLRERLALVEGECDWLDDILATPWRKSDQEKSALGRAEARVKELEEQVESLGADLANALPNLERLRP